MLAFAGVLVVLFLSSLNTTVVGTALPRIIAELGGLNLYTWAFTGFTLAQTVSIPIYGKLSDMYGRKPILLIGILLFSAGSVLGGFSQSMGELIAFRALQGLGGGALMSMAFATIGDIFTPLERGKYQGFTGAVFGVSSVVGPLVGGLLTDHLSWRSVFFVNIPFAVLAFFVITRYLRVPLTPRPARVDYLGALLLIATTVPLMVALTWAGTTYAWTSVQVLGLLVGAAVMLTAFIVRQAKSSSPILELGLFRNPTFTISNVAGFLSMAGMYGAILYLPLYMQAVKGASATNSGLTLSPLMLGLILTSTTAGLAVSRTGRYKPFILAGLFTMTVAMFLGHLITPTTSALLVTGLMVMLGLGLGPTNSLFTLAVQNALPREKLGVATSVNQFFRNMGGTIGAAVFGTIQSVNLHAVQLPAVAHTFPPALRQAVTNPNVLTSPEALEKVQGAVTHLAGQTVFGQILLALRASLTNAVTEVFLLASVLAGLGFLVTLALPNTQLEVARQSTPSGPVRE